ncbi:MAG: hypothetical protein IH607_09250 [Firmicutes bacterium]|nr:hypothetical protein [Bacillota bacterium]
MLLSGGDSLLIANAMVRKWLEALTKIGHLDCIRFGTRIPVTFPRRITENPELVEILRELGVRKQIVIVTQFNHPREITKQSIKAVRLLQGAGAIVKNQTVLLRGVNDDPQVLGLLLRKLTAIGCMPYYVFQCRPVKGVKGGFQVPLREGYDIVEAAKAMQNGLGKQLRYCMSHPTGKIELLGKTDAGDMITKYHEARDEADYGKIVIRRTEPEQCWYD